MPDPLRIASALSPVFFALGDPDLLVELLNSNPAGVVLVEAADDLPVVYCNESFQRWVSPEGQPLVGRSLPDLFGPADRASVRSAFREAIRTGRPSHQRQGPAGRPPHWMASHYPLRRGAGRVTHVLSILVDVSGQMSARARMRDGQRRVLSALEGISRQLTTDHGGHAFFHELSGTIADLVAAGLVSFWLYDPDTETASRDPGAFGFEVGEPAGPVSCRPGGHTPLERAVFGDQVVREDGDAVFLVPWKAGERRLGALQVSGPERRPSFTDEDAWVLQAAATAAALVWEHREADDAMAALRERESARLQQQIDQSIELEQLKTEFLKLASHELRNPLSIVRGYLSMMEDGTLGPVGEDVESVLPMLRAKLDEMNQLINEILETARLEESSLQLGLSRVDLCEVVRDAVHGLEPLAAPRHRLVTELSDTPVPVLGDRPRLGMIVTNLVHNAIKYSPRGGEVRVGCRCDERTARVTVSDQGIGVAPADQARLFTRFGRIVGPDTIAIPGTGLGLYLARDLARHHGGDIEVQSEPGRGSTFTLTLPVE